MQQKTKFFVSRDRIFGDTIAIRIGKHIDLGQWAAAEPIQFRALSVEDRNREIAPALDVAIEDAQALMDELWHVGLRPTEGSGSAGSLAATQKHLSDMRMLVGKTHGIEFK